MGFEQRDNPGRRDPDWDTRMDRPSVSSVGRSTQKRWWLNTRVLAGAGAAVGALAILALVVGKGGSSGEVRTILADKSPVRLAPEDPGGMEVANRDRLIYDRVKGTAEGQPVERLLPAPEQPVLPPPQAAAPAAKPAVPAPTPVAPHATAAVPVPPPAVAAPVPPPAAAPSPSQPTTQELAEPDVEEPEPDAAPAAPKPEPRVLAKPPVVAALPTPQPAPAPKAAPAPAPEPSGGYTLQLAAARDRTQAFEMWFRLKDKNSDVLNGLKPSVVRADLGDKGVYWRLRAGPVGSAEKAKSLCSTLAGRRVDCLVVRPGA